MSISVTFNGQIYIIPTTNEVGWGTNLDDYLVALAAGALQKTGGSFTLSAETDFGGSFGLKSLYVKSRTINPASTGILRLANGDLIEWRNGTNTGDVGLTVNASNQLVFNGVPVQQTSLTSAHILVGNVSNVATDVAMSGDVSITNTGATAVNNVQALVITDAMVNASAAIALSKLAALTASRVLVSDGSGVISASSVTSTTLGFLDATSSIQTQLNSKATDSLVVHLAGIENITGSKTFTAAINNSLTSNQLVLGTGQTITISAPTPVANRIVTIPDAGTNANMVLTEANQTINGNKTFSQIISITATINQFELGVLPNSFTITAPTPAAHRTYTIPDALTSASFVMTEGNQTINGSKTFGSAIIGSLTGTASNNATKALDNLASVAINTSLIPSSGLTINLGSTPDHLWLNGYIQNLTLGKVGNAGNLIIYPVSPGTNNITVKFSGSNGGGNYLATIPDLEIDSTFVMTEGNQTINGNKNFGGIVTQPSQPCFLVTNSAGATDVTGDGTVYTVLWGNEIFDQGNNFASNTFTAPVTGRYSLQANVLINGITTNTTQHVIKIVTSNRTYAKSIRTSVAADFISLDINVANADMDANDTAYVTITSSNGTKVIDVSNDASYNYFSGSLIN